VVLHSHSAAVPHQASRLPRCASSSPQARVQVMVSLRNFLPACPLLSASGRSAA
jgi:hypothetical protein